MKFGTMTQIGLYSGKVVKISNFIQDGGGRHLEKSQKSRYLRNGLTDLYKIWYSDAKCVP